MRLPSDLPVIIAYRRMRIIVVGVLAYHNSFDGEFVFDDTSSIADNPTIRQLWPIWDALSPPAHGRAVQSEVLPENWSKFSESFDRL